MRSPRRIHVLVLPSETSIRVPPGRYNFSVIAANDDGLWNTKGANVAFEISRT